jgi:hypothetical protein
MTGERASDRESCETCCQTTDHGRAQVGEAVKPRAFSKIPERLVIEGRISRESTHYADREDGTRRRRDEPRRERKMHEAAEEKRARDVHRECAVGKRGPEPRERPARLSTAHRSRSRRRGKSRRISA